MGREVYSSPEAEAIANIDSAVADLEIVVDDLKNTDVANIATAVADLVTPNKYIPFGYAESIPASDPDYSVLSDWVNIQGVGVVSEFHIGGYAETYGTKVEMWLDGVKVLFSSSALFSYSKGFAITNPGNVGDNYFWSYTLTGVYQNFGVPYVYTQDIRSAPYDISLNSNNIAIIPSKPLYFNESCVVKFKTNSSRAVYLRLEGGVV